MKNPSATEQSKSEYAGAMESAGANPAPLAGIRVLEFSHTVMGPCAGVILADLGADVIKIEPSPDGDRTRQLSGFAGGFFATFNRNKRSLAIDLKTTAGQAAVHELVRSSDVIVENYGPGTMERLGCGWETLHRMNPGLIYLALKGYLNGPWANRPALDEVVQFQSGLAYMTGPCGQPLRAGASIVDILGAVFGVTGVLSALRERDRTGNGQRVGSALFESAVFMMATHMTGGKTTGETVPPMTLRKGAWGVYDVFKSSDNHQLFIGVTSDAQWQRFVERFEFSDLVNAQDLATNEQRNAARARLIPDLETRFANLSFVAIITGCQDADVSWSPVGRPEDLYENEQLLAGEGLLETALETALDTVSKTAPIPGLPLEFGQQRRRATLRRQPPTIGQHSLEILRESGFNEKNLTKLQNEQIICSPDKA